MAALRFRAGDRARVLQREKTGHVRVPYYIRGKTGVVERCTGSFLNPEDLAFGRVQGPVVPVYRLEFRHRDVWPDYAGHPDDRLYLEIYDHWLEAA